MNEQVLYSAVEKNNSPFFLYDIDGLNQHLAGFAPFFEEGIELWYACKANPLSNVLSSCYRHNFGIDVASIGELKQAMKVGVPGEKIIATGPAKSKEYLRELLSNGVSTIVLESVQQALWLDEVAAQLGKKAKVLLRAQLDWEAESSVLGGSEITPFGIEKEQWQTVDFSALNNVEIIGFHVFQWGNILDLSRLESIWLTIAEQVNDLARYFSVQDNYILDLGGGIGIPYRQEERALNKKDVLSILKKIKKKTKAQKIWMELGRYAVGDFGLYFNKVIERKEVKGESLLVMEGGINHLMRPTLTDQSFPCFLLRGGEDTKKIHFKVHGPLCTALDQLGSAFLPADTAPGDWIVSRQVGAYGFTESMPFFLCHQIAAELTLEKGEVHTKRPAQEASTWLV